MTDTNIEFDIVEAQPISLNLISETPIQFSLTAGGSGGSGSGAVDSVNGQTGVVVLDTDDVSEGSLNLYFTNERVDDRVNSLLQEGNAIDLTYNDVANTLTIAVTPSALDGRWVLKSGDTMTGRLTMQEAVNLSSTNASPVAGDIWYDTDSNVPAFGMSSIQTNLSSALYTQVVSKTIPYNDLGYSMYGSGVGVAGGTLPASFFTQGKCIKIKARGYISTGSSPPTLTVRVDLGNTTIGTIETYTPKSLHANDYIELDFDFVCINPTPSSATFQGQGKFTIQQTSSSSQLRPLLSTLATSLDISSGVSLTPRLIWGSGGSASDTATITNLIIEVFN